MPKPIHFRYAWARNPHANLVSAWDKLPLATQRSDTWTLADLYKSFVGKEPMSQTDKLQGDEMGELKKSLQAADLKRRLYEAKVFLEEHEPFE